MAPNVIEYVPQTDPSVMRLTAQRQCGCQLLQGTTEMEGDQAANPRRVPTHCPESVRTNVGAQNSLQLAKSTKLVSGLL